MWLYPPANTHVRAKNRTKALLPRIRSGGTVHSLVRIHMLPFHILNTTTFATHTPTPAPTAPTPAPHTHTHTHTHTLTDVHFPNLRLLVCFRIPDLTDRSVGAKLKEPSLLLTSCAQLPPCTQHGPCFGDACSSLPVGAFEDTQDRCIGNSTSLSTHVIINIYNLYPEYILLKE